MIIRACLFFVLLSSSVGASEIGISYSLGEFENSTQGKQRQVFIEHDLSDRFYTKALLVDRSSQESLIDTDEAFLGGGFMLSLSRSLIRGDILFSDDTWRINPRAESRLSDRFSLTAGLMHRNRYKSKASTTMLHGGLRYKLTDSWSTSCEYWVGNFTKRSVNDFILFGITKAY